MLHLLLALLTHMRKATLKAHYDLLKEYKQGLLVDADLEEEIELYEETLVEVGESSSTTVDVSVPESNEPKFVPSELQSNVDPPEGRETQP